MRLVKTDYNLEEEFLGKTIYDEKGRALIVEGSKLRKGLIDGLLGHNITYIYVRDDRTDDINVEEIIPLEMRIEATNQIKDTFDSIRKDSSKIDSIVSSNVGKFKDIVKNITRQLLNNKQAISLMSTVKSYDDHLFTHSLNVMIYSTQVALSNGYDEKSVENIGMGALLHDVGKLMIPLPILNKTGRLSDSEFEIIKDHAQIGFDILRKQHDISLLSAHCAFQHHERIDGSGYPRNLKANEIHDFAKIMGIADVFDAVTSDRAYRKAMLPHEAIELIYAGAGTHFDIDLVNVFKKNIVIYPEGTGVKLSNGMSGVVFKYDTQFTGRPIIRILKDEKGNSLKNGFDVNLATELSTMIIDSDLIL